MQPSLPTRAISRLLAAYLRFVPVSFGKWRLRTLLAPWLVARLEPGPWIRVSGVSKFEWLVLTGEAGGERSTVKSFTQLLAPGDTMIDIGANIGFFALIGASIVGDSGRVVAFEPDPIVADRARENASLNGMTNLAVVTSAVGAAPGTLQLHRGGWDSEGSSLYLQEPDAPGDVLVPVTTLDAWLETAGIDRVAVLKIDAEGAELDIIAGAGQLLSRNDAPAIIIEANPVTLRAAGVTTAQLRSALAAHGYVMTVIETMEWRGEMVENWLARKGLVFT